jgi:hypothetical protein
MDGTYDIFRTYPDDERPVWIEAVASLEHAKERLRTLPSLPFPDLGLCRLTMKILKVKSSAPEVHYT